MGKAIARSVTAVRACGPAMDPLPANQFRYALYLAPPPESDLWRFGCHVIGRDASTGASREGSRSKAIRPTPGGA